MKSNNCKRRNDVAGQSIDIERHVCLVDTSVQILQKHNVFMADSGHEFASFSDRTIFENMFHDITSCKSRKVQNECLAQSERSNCSHIKIQSRLLVFLWIREDLGKMNIDHLTSLQTEDGTVSRFGWKRGLSSANTQCPNILQSSVMMRRKKGGGAGTVFFKTVPENHLTLVKMILACNQLPLFLFELTMWMQDKNQVQIRTSFLELNQEEIAALIHHKPQVCA